MYSLLTALKQTHTKSVLGLKAALSSKRSSVVEMIQTHLIHQRYTKHGGSNGPFGFPTGEVQFANKQALRHYRGGDIYTTTPMQAGGDPLRMVRVTFMGFKCKTESDHDQSSPADEPYFVVTLAPWGQLPTVKKFAYENIESGTEVSESTFLNDSVLSPNPLNIHVAAFENDQGDPEETAKTIQNKMIEIAKAAQQAAALAGGADAADGPGIGPAAAAGGIVGILTGPLGAVVAFVIVALLGLGDDYIQEGGTSAFDDQDVEPKEPEELGEFKEKPYNAIIAIDGGGEGKYELYFRINLDNFVPQPAPA